MTHQYLVQSTPNRWNSDSTY